MILMYVYLQQYQHNNCIYLSRYNGPVIEKNTWMREDRFIWSIIMSQTGSTCQIQQKQLCISKKKKKYIPVVKVIEKNK